MTRDHFSELRPEQLEALALLAEECGEVVHIIGKIMRHGLHSYDPTKLESRPSNRELLVHEVGDLRAATAIAESVGLFFEHEVRARCAAKLKNVRQYLHHIQMPEGPDD
jgi:hypothetical protein